MNIKIGLTGGSGNMGVEALKQFLELEFIDKIKSSLNAAKIKIKGIYPNKRAKKAAGKINQKIEPYLISFCFTR